MLTMISLIWVFVANIGSVSTAGFLSSLLTRKYVGGLDKESVCDR